MSESARPPRRPRVGVVKFASCDGCQLTLLDLEDSCSPIAERFDIVEFAEATSRRSAALRRPARRGLDQHPEQAEEIVRLRRQATLLVTIGACASAGGIQALRNWADHDAFRRAVYPHPEYDRVARDRDAGRRAREGRCRALRLPDLARASCCELLTALAVGRRPQLPDEAVCLECKRAATPCILVAQGAPCLGPVTRTGCGALCPTFGRGCYGCFGPREQANAASLARGSSAAGPERERGRPLFAGFTVWCAAPFRAADASDGPGATAVTPAGSRARRRRTRDRDRRRRRSTSPPHARRGRGLAVAARPRRRGRRGPPGHLRGAALLRAARRRPDAATRSSTSSPASAASARSRTR